MRMTFRRFQVWAGAALALAVLAAPTVLFAQAPEVTRVTLGAGIDQ